MKILHIVPTYLPAYRYGGPIHSVHTMNKWLVEKGIDVTVYTTNIDGPEDLPAYDKEPRVIDGVKVFYFKNSFRPWFYSKDMKKALKENVKNFDLVHITSVFLAISTLGAHYAKEFGKPYIISPRGSLMSEPLQIKSFFKKKLYLALIEKRNLKDASAIHFTSEKEVDEYFESKLLAKKSFVVPNALSPEEFKEEYKVSKEDFSKKLNIPRDKKIVLSLGRLSWKKGFDTLVPAFAEVVKEDPNAVLVVAGNDDEGYKKEIDKLIKENGLEKNVIFTGLILGRDKIAAIKGSNVFVLPSYSENFGMSIVEAMYLGCPVLITKNVGISPTISKNNAGVVVDKSVSGVAKGILDILKNEANTQGMALRARELVNTEFVGDKVAEAFIKEYKLLIS